MSVAHTWPDHLLELAEWDALADGAPSNRLELVEGVLLVTPKPAPLHQRAMARLCEALDRQLSSAWTALPDTEVLVHAAFPATVRAPDIVVVANAVAEANPPRLPAAQVQVAVEILSPGTRATDRVTKPAEYAQAGIPLYWLVELGEVPLLTAFQLVDGVYRQVARCGGVVNLAAPEPVRIDVAALTRR